MQPYNQPWKVVFDRTDSAGDGTGDSTGETAGSPTPSDRGAEQPGSHAARSHSTPSISTPIPIQSTPYYPGSSQPSPSDDAHDEQTILSFEQNAASTAATAQGDGDVPAAETVEALIKAAHILRGVLSEHFAEFGLSDIRYLVMKMISEADAGGCSQAQLAVHLQQSESSISTLIDRMRGDDLIYRLPSQIDRRKKVLMLSDKGLQMLARIEVCHERRMQYLLDKIGLEHPQQFATDIACVAERLVALSSENVLRNWPAAPASDQFIGESYRKSA